MPDGLKEWKKPEIEDISSGEPGKEKAELTEEQKDHIRVDLESELYDTPEKTSKRRKQLAIFYGTTVKQIAAVSAYKKRDGKLSLEPKFEELPPAPPQIEAVYDNPTKRAWRHEIKKAINSDLDKERLHNAHVVCLPGQALQEVTDVYIPLGIQPQNIVCIEQDPDVAKTMRKNVKTLVQTKILSQPVTIFEGTVEKYLKSQHEPVTIASFDFLGPAHHSFWKSLPNLRTSEKFMIITNFLQKRELKDSQKDLRIATTFGRVLQARPRPDVKQAHFGSELFKSRDKDKRDFKQQLEDVLSGQTPVELSDARHEGVASGLAIQMVTGESRRAVDDLYAEVGASLPPLKPDELDEFKKNAVLNVATTIERAFEEYPGLIKKLTPIRDVDSAGKIKGRGRRGFLLFMMPITQFCFKGLMHGNTQRYEYSSESAGSPYQTDIVTIFDWRPSFKERHPDAYFFIREFFRVLGQHGKDAVTLRLETPNNKVLPRTSESIVGVQLALCINDIPHKRVSLRNLLQLINYFTQTLNDHGKAGMDDRPRIKIEAS